MEHCKDGPAPCLNPLKSPLFKQHSFWFAPMVDICGCSQAQIHNQLNFRARASSDKMESQLFSALQGVISMIGGGVVGMIRVMTVFFEHQVFRLKVGRSLSGKDRQKWGPYHDLPLKVGGSCPGNPKKSGSYPCVQLWNDPWKPLGMVTWFP